MAEHLKEYIAETQADIDDNEARGNTRGAASMWRKMQERRSRLEDIIWKLDKRMGRV